MPTLPIVTLSGTDLSFPAGPDDTLLQAALRAGVAWPYECSVGACGTCKFTLMAGQVDELRDDAPGLSTRDKQRGRKLGCQCVAQSNLEINVHLESNARSETIPPKRLTVRLIEVMQVSHDICAYRFQGPTPATFLAGQYALLSLPGVNGIRAYSMSNTENADGIWEFMIRRVPGGQASRALTSIRINDSFVLDGPYGIAYFRTKNLDQAGIDQARDIVCIAGGSGLAPMLSIARAKANSPAASNRKLHFFYGARTPADACCHALISQLPGFGESLSCTQAVSSDSDGTWQGPIGPIHEVAAAQLERALNRFEFYLSGPAPMITASVTSLVREHAVPQSQIHFDRFF